MLQHGEQFSTNVDMRKIQSPLNGLRGGRPTRRKVFERLMDYKGIYDEDKREEYIKYLMNPYIKEIPSIREDLAEAEAYYKKEQLKRKQTLFQKNQNKTN